MDILVLKKRPDTIEVVRKEFGLNNDKELNEAIDSISDWVQKQNHFTETNFSREYLERMLITAKGSVERTKTYLDKVCTMRTLMPKYFEDLDMKNYLEVTKDKIYLSNLPILTKENDRVFLGRCSGNEINTKVLLQGYKFAVMMTEYGRLVDYPNGYHIIIDLRHANLTTLISSINLTDLNHLVCLLIQGYAVRIRGIHFVTPLKIVDTLVAILKQVVSEKIGQRINVHKTLDSLFEIVPQELFPAEYGGQEKSLPELQDDWVKVLSSDEYTQYWRKMCKARTDEALRQTDKFNEQYMGMPGSFRTLSVD